jgi:hypothetical protein
MVAIDPLPAKLLMPVTTSLVHSKVAVLLELVAV